MACIVSLQGLVVVCYLFSGALAWTVGQTVNTSSGPVRGHAAVNLTDVSEYLGIPYAQPPVGNLRFQPPVKYTGTKLVAGDAFGPACLSSRAASAYDPAKYANITVTKTAIGVIEEMASTANQSEDCLTVNVWTKPQTGEQNKAVLVWIHGGGYVSGSSAVPWYNGQFLSGEEDVVVVSMNYRLNIFGFPGNPTTRLNLGLLDQRLAVEWVRDNIASFGGDPNRITLFGQSAGGGSVDIYSYAWTADPIVKAFIPMSGTAAGFNPPTNASANALWFNATTEVGCGGAQDDHDKVYQCMLSKPAADIVSKLPSGGGSAGAGLTFSPTVDETIVFSNYTGRAPIPGPVLVGNTDFEAGLFRLLSPQVPENYWPIFNQAVFVCPAAKRAAESVLHGNPTWRYRYFGVFPNLVLSTHPPSGAWHASDLPVLFNTTPTNSIPDTPAEGAIGAYLRGAWAAFARDPVNGLVAYGWPRYSTDASTLVRLAYNNQTGPNLAIGNQYDNGCKDVPVVVSPNGTLSTPTPSGTTTATSTPSANANVGGRFELRVGMAIWLSIITLALC